MVLVAGAARAEGGDAGDAATAAMAAFAGFEPHVSVVLKKVRGVQMPIESQFSPGEIKGLSEEEIIPIIDPALIPGESLHFAEGRCFTTDESLLYVDIVRVARRHRLPAQGGPRSARSATRASPRPGMTRVKARTEGILGPLAARRR